MKTLRIKIARILAATISCLFLNATLCAATSRLESNSPFLPSGYGKLKSSPPTSAQQPVGSIARELEFRGIVQFDGVYHFSLYQKSENKGYWIPENTSENGIEVQNFNADSMQIWVTFNGRTEQLSLMAASENPIPVTSRSSPAQNIKAPPLPPNIQPQNNAKKDQPVRRTIPRRRVIIPPTK